MVHTIKNLSNINNIKSVLYIHNIITKTNTFHYTKRIITDHVILDPVFREILIEDSPIRKKKKFFRPIYLREVSLSHTKPREGNQK